MQWQRVFQSKYMRRFCTGAGDGQHCFGRLLKTCDGRILTDRLLFSVVVVLLVNISGLVPVEPLITGPPNASCVAEIFQSKQISLSPNCPPFCRNTVLLVFLYFN